MRENESRESWNLIWIEFVSNQQGEWRWTILNETNPIRLDWNV